VSCIKNCESRHNSKPNVSKHPSLKLIIVLIIPLVGEISDYIVFIKSKLIYMFEHHSTRKGRGITLFYFFILFFIIKNDRPERPIMTILPECDYSSTHLLRAVQERDLNSGNCRCSLKFD
jgi:hypothetical protein